MIGLLAGIFIIAVVLYDVFQSVVVPRWTPSHFRLSPLLIERAWPVWRWFSHRLGSGERRENFLGAFAPLLVLTTLVAWTLSLIVGFGLSLYALRGEIRPEPQDLPSAFYLAGVALFTLGFGDLVPTGLASRVVVLVAAASGLAVVALVISLLFNLHASFQRRETTVLLLDARAGAPPSGVMLLDLYARLEMRGELSASFAAWETWAAEILESHRAFPLLPYFRASHENSSWVDSLGAMLDASALILTTLEGGPRGPALLMHRMGSHAVADLNLWCGLECGPEVGVTREEWNEACQRLEAAGYALREPETAWREFSRLRSRYAGPLNALARHFVTPPVRWLHYGPVRGHHTDPIQELEEEGDPRIAPGCPHTAQVREVAPHTKGCEECLKMGERWVHLRLCRTCGHVGCCDSSKHRHATQHFHATGHPIIESLEPGDGWAWCYVDETYVELP